MEVNPDKNLQDIYAAMRGSKPTKRRLVKPTEKGNRFLIMAALTEMSLGLATMQELLAHLIALLTPKEK